MKKAAPFLISALITGVTMVSISFFIEDDFQSKSTLVAGLIAAITIAAIPIYDINRWSLLKRSAVHFLIMVVTVLPLLFYSGWFSPVVSVVVFLLFGAAGWSVGYGINALQTRTAKRRS